MRILLLSLAVLGVFGGSLRAQAPGCGTGRYTTEQFSFTLQDSITYGSAVDVNGATQTLQLDVYTPTGDTETKRPLIVLFHGGSFLGGDRTQTEVTQFCEAFAKRGYVTATVSYRLGVNFTNFLTDQLGEMMKAVVRGTHDGRAAIRYFYKSVKSDGNPYGIDTNLIFIGGSSAGAFIALHNAYLDSEAELAEMGVDTQFLTDMGGIEGTSGNAGYSTKLAGVVNLCGALGRATWLEAGDPPLISLHGTADDVVPYRRGPASGINAVEVEGSYLIDSVAQLRGVYSAFYTYCNQGHVPYVNGDFPEQWRDTTIFMVQDYLYKFICGSVYQGPVLENRGIDCSTVVAVNPALDNKYSLSVYPVPAATSVTVEWNGEVPANATVTLTDLAGRTVFSKEILGEAKFSISRPQGANGMYLLTITTPDHTAVQRIAFAD